jgi:flagellar biosynthetic protein FliS
MNAYRRVDLESAPKTQIVDRLFERFDRDLAETRVALASKNIKGKAASLDHALRIVAELRAALDHAVAPEMCANLDGLYAVVVGRLLECNMTLDPKPLDLAGSIMGELGSAMKQAGQASAGVAR